MSDQRRLMEAVLRNDLASFVRAIFPIVSPGPQLLWNWHLDAMCHALTEVMNGTTRRLIIEVPPRYLKSITTSVALPAFMLGRDPRKRILAASYSQDLAIKHANDCRAVMLSALYQHLFPMTVIGGKNTEVECTTTARGFRYATSPSGTMTGRGGDLIILDDIMNPREALSPAKRQAVKDWYSHTAFSRLDQKKDGAIILVMQRLHVDDMSGWLREQGDFSIVSLPGIAEEPAKIAIGPNRFHDRQVGDLLHPEREPREKLDEQRRVLGSHHFFAQVQQRPSPIEGEVLKWSWLKFYDKLPEFEEYKVVVSWDIAIGPGENNDFSVGTVWFKTKRDHYLIDVVRGQWDFPQLCGMVVQIARQYRADVILVENKVTGTALIQQLKHSREYGVPNPIGCMPQGDKLTRALGESPTIEAGHVFLRAGAAWLGDLKAEWTSFPASRNDDQVDSISQYLRWVRERSGPSVGTASLLGVDMRDGRPRQYTLPKRLL